jgi:hypothetical protein
MATRIVRTLFLGFLVLAVGCGDRPRDFAATVTDAELRQTLQQWGVVPIGRPPAQTRRSWRSAERCSSTRF